MYSPEMKSLDTILKGWGIENSEGIKSCFKANSGTKCCNNGYGGIGLCIKGVM